MIAIPCWVADVISDGQSKSEWQNQVLGAFLFCLAGRNALESGQGMPKRLTDAGD